MPDLANANWTVPIPIGMSTRVPYTHSLRTLVSDERRDSADRSSRTKVLMCTNGFPLKILAQSWLTACCLFSFLTTTVTVFPDQWKADTPSALGDPSLFLRIVYRLPFKNTFCEKGTHHKRYASRDDSLSQSGRCATDLRPSKFNSRKESPPRIGSQSISSTTIESASAGAVGSSRSKLSHTQGSSRQMTLSRTKTAPLALPETGDD